MEEVEDFFRKFWGSNLRENHGLGPPRTSRHAGWPKKGVRLEWWVVGEMKGDLGKSAGEGRERDAGGAIYGDSGGANLEKE